MRRILFSILFVLYLTGTTFAYTPNEKDIIAIDAVTKKVEAIISKGTSRAKFIRALETLKEKQAKNERISYLVSAVIEHLQATDNTTYVVTSVTDGDTIKVIRNSETKTIRIIGIDTPEKYSTRTGYEECYGREASEFATKALS
ncbi:MAG: hypothetical protein ACD_28C00432G0003 [uncultured bacterium]|nr:MAG: hypothetical protein ACD_28C00432G0003 [uncultured bacterium]